jgi:hypothetical protein
MKEVRPQATHDIEMDEVWDECTPLARQAEGSKVELPGLERICERSRNAETHNFERLPAVERQA